MKRLFTSLLILTSIIWINNSNAYSYLTGWYTTLKGGGSYLQAIKNNISPDQKTTPDNVLALYSKPTYNFGASVGYKLDRFRVEFASNFSQLRIDDVNITEKGEQTQKLHNKKNITGFFYDFCVNGYYDRSLDGPVKLVFGGGIGYARAKIIYDAKPHKKFDKTNNLFVYNLMAGFRMNLNHMWNVFLEYRFLGSTSTTVGYSSTKRKHEDPIYLHSVSLGLLIKLC